MTNRDASSTSSVPHGDAPSANDDAASELALFLERAGITLPPERIPEVAIEYAAFKEQIALVNRSVTAQDEPAVIFVAPSRARPE